MSSLRRISTLITSDMATKVAGYLILPLYLTGMSKENFGESTFILLISGSLVTVLSLGMYVPLIRLYGLSNEIESEKKDLVKTAFVAITIWSALFTSLMVVPALQLILGSTLGITGDVPEKIVGLGVLTGLGVVHLYIYAFLMAESKKFRLAVYILLRFTMNNGFSLAALYMWPRTFEDQGTIRIYGYICGEIISCIPYFMGILKSAWSGRYKRSKLELLLREGVSILPTSIIALTCITLDRSLVSQYYGPAELADYNLVMALAVPISSILAAFQAEYTPRIYGSVNETIALNQIKHAVKVLSCVFMVASILIYLIVGAGFEFELLPSAYRNIVIYLPFALIVVSLNSIIQIASALFIYTKRYHVLTRFSLIQMMILSALAYTLIPRCGVYGALVSNLLSALLVFIAYFILSVFIQKKSLYE